MLNMLDTRDHLNANRLNAILSFVRSHGHPEARIACGRVVWRTCVCWGTGQPVSSVSEQAITFRDARNALGY